MDIDFQKIEEIFKQAHTTFLLEHEVYAVLNAAGIPTPVYSFLPLENLDEEIDLQDFRSGKVVVKVVSPLIQHKSDLGGVRFIDRDSRLAARTVKQMAHEIPLQYREWSQKYLTEGSPSEIRSEDNGAGIQGFMICESVDYDQLGYGSELLLGLRNSREFGPVVTMGSGGLDVEYMAEQIKEGRAVAISAAHLMDRGDSRRTLASLAFYAKLTRPFRGGQAKISSELLEDVYIRFQKLARHFSPYAEGSGFVIEEAEVNPLVISRGGLVALDGTCRVSRDRRLREERPNQLVRHLLRPESIGIIGVSNKMNIGHIILNKVLSRGFSPARIYVVKPGVERIEGCACVPTPADLPEPVDLFVLTVSAEQSLSVLQELAQHSKARSVIIIAGGIGEKEGTGSLEKDIRALLSDGRRKNLFMPVINGGNCLGVFSRPGRYDTTFVPDHKLYSQPRKKAIPAPLVFISQSGAFMISRMSRMPDLEPLYAVSIGNQIDLTVSDYLRYLKNENEAEIFAVYIEGFMPDDGLEFARAAKEITRSPKRAVVVYKAGRSPEGRAATAGHTASVAGDYSVSKSVLHQSGVILAENIFEFESLIKGLCRLHEKTVTGNRVGLLSNAGFECVIMSDSLPGDDGLSLSRFSQSTKERIRGILTPLGIDRLQDVKNPLDITPVADDATFCAAVEAVLEDDEVDCAVISPLPMTASLRTLASSSFHQEDFTTGESTANRLIEIFNRTEKPFVVCLDAGENYQPMADYLEAAGIPVFRRSDEAVRFLRKFVFHRLRFNSFDV